MQSHFTSQYLSVVYNFAKRLTTFATPFTFSSHLPLVAAIFVSVPVPAPVAVVPAPVAVVPVFAVFDSGSAAAPIAAVQVGAVSDSVSVVAPIAAFPVAVVFVSVPVLLPGSVSS